MCRAAVPITEFRRLSRHAASGPQARRMRRPTDFILGPPDPKGQPPTSDTLAIFDLDGLRCMAYNALGASGYQVLAKCWRATYLECHWQTGGSVVLVLPITTATSALRVAMWRARAELYGKLTANGRWFPFRWCPQARTIHLPVRRRPWLSPQAKHTRRDDD